MNNEVKNKYDSSALIFCLDTLLFKIQLHLDKLSNFITYLIQLKNSCYADSVLINSVNVKINILQEEYNKFFELKSFIKEYYNEPEQC